jgi:hypothetical protein
MPWPKVADRFGHWIKRLTAWAKMGKDHRELASAKQNRGKSLCIGNRRLARGTLQMKSGER